MKKKNLCKLHNLSHASYLRWFNDFTASTLFWFHKYTVTIVQSKMLKFLNYWPKNRCNFVIGLMETNIAFAHFDMQKASIGFMPNKLYFLSKFVYCFELSFAIKIY